MTKEDGDDEVHLGVNLDVEQTFDSRKESLDAASHHTSDDERQNQRNNHSEREIPRFHVILFLVERKKKNAQGKGYVDSSTCYVKNGTEA